MEFLHSLAMGFYELPLVSGVVQSNGVLRVASERYGVLLLGLLIVFIFLVATLVVMLGLFRPRNLIVWFCGTRIFCRRCWGWRMSGFT